MRDRWGKKSTNDEGEIDGVAGIDIITSWLSISFFIASYWSNKMNGKSEYDITNKIGMSIVPADVIFTAINVNAFDIDFYFLYWYDYQYLLMLSINFNGSDIFSSSFAPIYWKKLI